MTRKFPAFLAAVALSGAVPLHAQQSIIGSVTSVLGLVTMSDATNVTTVVQGTVIVDGARFVTSSSGSVTLLVNKNCEVKLKPNQSVVVGQDQPCEQILAFVQTLPGPVPVVGAANDTVTRIIGGAAIAVLLLGRGNGAPATGGGSGQVPDPPPPPPGPDDGGGSGNLPDPPPFSPQ